MTKNVVALSREFVVSKYMKFYDEMMQTKQPTIAQTIRDAAINWPQFLGDVECGILDAFCISSLEDFYFKDNLRFGTLKEKNQSRTFMLLVAEALE